MGNQNKIYDLEERAAVFAERLRDFWLKPPKNSANNVYIPQLLRAGSSPGSNYIEADESLGEKDFKLKIKTCPKESKETTYWLRLIVTDRLEQLENERKALRQESKGFYFDFYNNSQKQRKQLSFYLMLAI